MSSGAGRKRYATLANISAASQIAARREQRENAKREKRANTRCARGHLVLVIAHTAAHSPASRRPLANMARMKSPSGDGSCWQQLRSQPNLRPCCPTRCDHHLSSAKAACVACRTRFISSIKSHSYFTAVTAGDQSTARAANLPLAEHAAAACRPSLTNPKPPLTVYPSRTGLSVWRSVVETGNERRSASADLRRAPPCRSAAALEM